jgi:integrase
LGVGRKGPFTRKGKEKGKGGFKPLKPSSVKSRMFSLRQALAGLVLSGVRPEDIRTLADLVTPAAVEAILMHYWLHTIALRVARGELAAVAEHPQADGVSSQTGAIAAVLMMIARHIVVMEEEDRSDVVALCRDLIPVQTGRPAARNRARMRQFDEAAVLREALRVPATLMQDARRLLACNPPHTARAAQRARLACALKILFNIPIRIGNLCNLRFGINLHTGDPRSGRINRLTLSAAETKNSTDYEAWVAPEVADMIAEWRATFRPILAPRDSVYLFPSYPDREEPLTIDAMREAIEIALADEIGIQMHPHLFRQLMAHIVLTNNPGAIEDVRQLLGDKTLGVVLASYVIVSQEQAGKRYDAALRAAMNAPPEATPKPVRRRGRPAR